MEATNTQGMQDACAVRHLTISTLRGIADDLRLADSALTLSDLESLRQRTMDLDVEDPFLPTKRAYLADMVDAFTQLITTATGNHDRAVYGHDLINLADSMTTGLLNAYVALLSRTTS